MLTVAPSAALRPLKSAPDWQKALEDAQLDGRKKPLPLEVFKVSRTAHKVASVSGGPPLAPGPGLH